MTDRARFAIVTPYYQEEKWLLERCIRSVREQTLRADHILVADGFPQDWIDGEDVRHIRLDCAHADYGNTPRTIGALLGVSAGYEGIGFLDADNWYELEHVARCAEAAGRSAACDYVIAQRHLRRPDGSIIEVDEPPLSRFVDMNCFFLLPGSYHVIPHLSLTPQPLSPVCDRVFYAALKAKKLNSQIVPGRTVNYHCIWRHVYQHIGEQPPPEAKGGIDYKRIKDWLVTLSERQRQIVYRRVGCRLDVVNSNGVWGVVT